MNQKKKQRRLLPCLLLLLCAALVVGLLSFKRLQKVAYPQKYQEYVEYYAGKYQLDPLLIYTVIRTESGFDAAAYNATGARGLMQITETTFEWLKSRIAPTEDLTYEDLDDPETNIRFGTYYVACCLERYQGDLSTAAASYYSGWGTVDGLLQDPAYSSDQQTLSVFPYARMQEYVRRINRTYQIYQKLYGEEQG